MSGDGIDMWIVMMNMCDWELYLMGLDNDECHEDTDDDHSDSFLQQNQENDESGHSVLLTAHHAVGQNLCCAGPFWEPTLVHRKAVTCYSLYRQK